MFINYTPYDGVQVEALDSGLVSIEDIARIVPATRGGGSIIILKSGGSLRTATEPDRLQSKIDQALAQSAGACQKCGTRANLFCTDHAGNAAGIKLEKARTALLSRGQMLNGMKQQKGNNKQDTAIEDSRIEEIAGLLKLLE